MADISTRREFLAAAAGTAAAAAASGSLAEEQAKVFRAGAAAVDISPTKFPVIVNGGMSERTADKVVDPLHARCLVLDDASTRAAIVMVDSCVVPRALADRAKEQARAATGIPTERMLIAATHTHSAPSVLGALGSDADEAYAEQLEALILLFGDTFPIGFVGPAKLSVVGFIHLTAGLRGIPIMASSV